MDEYLSNEEFAHTREMHEINKAHEVGIDEFGVSSNPFQHTTEALKARIFHGANRVELAFFGKGKGSREQPTPEMMGERERRDMRELAIANAVETTTHASVNAGALSGLQQGKFSEEQRKETVDEIKRAIHFAAEASTGGAIVFHLQEAPRPMHSSFKKNGEASFERHPYEKKEEIHYLVDPELKNILGEVKENDFIFVPIPKKDDHGNVVYLKDDEGNYVTDEIFEKYDTEHQGRIPVYEYDREQGIRTKKETFKDFRERKEKEIKEQEGRESNRDDQERIVREFLQYQQLLQVQYNLGFGKQAEQQYMDYLEKRKKLLDSLKFYKELKGKVPEGQWWKYKRQMPGFGAPGGLFVPPDVEDPVEYLENELKHMDRGIIYGRETALSGKRQAQEILEKISRSQLIERFARTKAAESIGELGVYAWQKNEQHKKDLNNPLYVSPENLFPETYGSHPDELRDVILSGRKKMQETLESMYGMDKKKANQLASKHIKATLDIGHLNTWRKYFKSKTGESLEERDKRFNKWAIKKTRELFDKGIIGHIHVSDNFGFHDEHLAAGDGNAPVKEFIQLAKDAGLEDFIVEGGGLNPDRALPDTWAHFDSPAYHVAVPGFTRDNWSNIWHGYFGHTQPPTFIFGDYSPSNDFRGEPFYTGLGLE